MDSNSPRCTATLDLLSSKGLPLWLRQPNPTGLLSTDSARPAFSKPTDKISMDGYLTLVTRGEDESTGTVAERGKFLGSVGMQQC